jgi:malate dehydrogenase
MIARFPLLKGSSRHADLAEGFKDVNWACLVGSVPRKAGMERGDLLGINGKIFIGQGQAIEKNASSDVRILVIGNPCNTNCLIAMNNARSIPRDRWFAMTRSMKPRESAARAEGGRRCHGRDEHDDLGQSLRDAVSRFLQRKIDGKSAAEVIGDESWLKETFIPDVQKRGAAIIKARGLSSAGSAANAIIDNVRSLTNDTFYSDWTSVAVCSDGSYGVPEGLISSFPVRVKGRQVGDRARRRAERIQPRKIDASVAELQEEQQLVGELLPKS